MAPVLGVMPRCDIPVGGVSGDALLWAWRATAAAFKKKLKMDATTWRETTLWRLGATPFEGASAATFP